MRFAAAELGVDWLRGRVGRSLEAGNLPLRSFWAERVWSHAVAIERRVVLPDRVAIIGVGGALLGGSGVTPLVRAIATELAQGPAAVAVASRGYRGRSASPSRIAPTASAAEYGDEAVELARALAPSGVCVVGGGTLEARLRQAARAADVVVVDGLLQTAPRRLHLSVLSLCGPRPWGAGVRAPTGDLRAAPDRLVGAADLVVHANRGEAGSGLAAAAADGVVQPARARTDGLWLPKTSEWLSLGALAGMRVGLVVGIARPERVVDTLSAEGLVLRGIIRLCDHAGAVTFRAHEARARRAAVDLWATTSKCATKLGDTYAGRPLGVLRHAVELPPALRERLSALGAGVNVRRSASG